MKLKSSKARKGPLCATHAGHEPLRQHAANSKLEMDAPQPGNDCSVMNGHSKIEFATLFQVINLFSPNSKLKCRRFMESYIDFSQDIKTICEGHLSQSFKNDDSDAFSPIQDPLNTSTSSEFMSANEQKLIEFEE
ncbi:hypothetical protein CEXT_571671 [Caerostris extrusa]|uniref:Uncharacterized protein n=1 Tax=Caerostris extrusa TaxID=172846 RepID=A0AAV4PIC9_CAEEX|nr:hypothetical protein CEXT_571671 [Caerostris extrusa]